MGSKSIRVIIKEQFELSYWRMKKILEPKLKNEHYKYFYTDYFSLPDSFYQDKTIMDVGCGPRGSLEWASMTKQRIGLDPLANKYLKFGSNKHEMTYVEAGVEDLPFPDNYFDVISSFNSLDHVDNLSQACTEIRRCLKPGGVFLLIVDIHKSPTLTEPQCMRWDFVKEHFPDFEIVKEKRLKAIHKGRIYSNLRAGEDIEGDESLNGVLTARLKKI